MKKNPKKKDKVTKVIEEEGFGKGFMTFLDGITGKLENIDDYEPEEYEFSDGEGIT
jgi:hypothetical protein